MNPSHFHSSKTFDLTRAAILLSVCAYLSSASAQGKQPESQLAFEPGWYVGAALADIGIASSGGALPRATAAADSSKFGGKLFGGYQISETFGVELGYLRASGLTKAYASNGANITQQGNASGLYLAGTGRVAISEKWILGAKLGLGRGQFDGTNVLPISNSIVGTKTGIVLGLGAEYRLTPKVSAVASYDYFPNAGERLRLGGLSIGIKASF
jgi:OmpA-OmpF porin, OOP family